MKKVFLVLACALMLTSCTQCSDDNSKQPNDNQQVTTVDDGLTADTLDVNGYIDRARYYLANEQVGMAIRDINSALSLDGKNVDALLVLTDIYYALGDQESMAITI